MGSRCCRSSSTLRSEFQRQRGSWDFGDPRTEGGIPPFLMPEHPRSSEEWRGMFHEQYHLDGRSRGYRSLHTWILWAPLEIRAAV
jgi:hypothetical protein